MKKKLFFVSLLVVFSLFFTPRSAFAEESIRSFDVSLTAHKNGVMSIVETIHYDFDSNYKHGIYRFIPLVSQVGNLYRVISIHVTTVERDGNSEQYAVSSSAEQTQVKIGNADKTITGLHTYEIEYDVLNGIGSNYTDHDEIYWNVTGNSWDVPIASSSILVKTDFGVLPHTTSCYTGVLGSRMRNCTISNANDGKNISTSSSLSPSEGFTVVSSFPVNTFPKSTLQKTKPLLGTDVIAFLRFLVVVYFLLNLILAPGLLYWYFKHRNKKRFGKPTVNFDTPEYPKGYRITPAEVGTIDTARLDKDDITATIFDLAIRKYIKIVHIQEKGKFLGLGKKDDYQLVKLKSFDDLTAFEKRLTTSIFTTDIVLLKEVTLDYTDFSSLEEKNFTSLIKRGFYSKNPKTQQGVLLFLGILMTCTLNLFLGPLLLFLSRKLNGRTVLGDEIDWKNDGLRLFLKSMSRHYTWQAEKAYIVERMIPYAIALGCIDEFMKQLKIVNPKYAPSWYSGSGNFYTAYPFFTTSFSSNITTSAPASSSGFAGGSGGGGGGGGGGSW
ncbi:MAG TPA: DUF2207 domain-containing protein [Candidatus Saccharimonadales bacterium]|nr:DUF2207 domain-containing protein [Candidatus Saccharimonadales bacterium]